MDLTTPALLFPAISLLLLAYTNRFVVLANVIRQLSNMSERSDDLVDRQIDNLNLRLKIIKWMQSLGVGSFILCSIAMLLIFLKLTHVGELTFGASLLLLVSSLVLSLWEVNISTRAINLEIEIFRRKRRESTQR